MRDWLRTLIAGYAGLNGGWLSWNYRSFYAGLLGDWGIAK